MSVYYFILFYKGLLKAVRRLIINRPLMLVFFGGATETAIAVISTTFNLKYIQTQFMKSPGTAAKLTGELLKVSYYENFESDQSYQTVSQFLALSVQRFCL